MQFYKRWEIKLKKLPNFISISRIIISLMLIATKSFKSSEKYTKLGHIINLGELPSGTIKVTFIKGE